MEINPYFMVMKAGVQVCSAFARGPRPPVDDPAFAFSFAVDGAGAGWYKVLHDAGDAFVCYGGTDDEEYNQRVMFAMPETNCTRDVEYFIATIKMRGLRNDGSIGDTLCKAILDSLRVDGTSSSLEAIFWSFRPGVVLKQFPSLEAANEAGLYE